MKIFASKQQLLMWSGMLLACSGVQLSIKLS